MKEQLDVIEREAKKKLAEVSREPDVLTIKARYLGRKGILTAMLKQIPALPEKERPSFGNKLNVVKKRIEELVEERLEAIKSISKHKQLSISRVDYTLPGRRLPIGNFHPIIQVQEEIEDIFCHLGFYVAEGPDVETDFNNFEALNIPKDHPARDMQDTFYISENFLLRTHTSPIQVRVMKSQGPPVKIICPGSAFRRDSDITHTPMFHQVEGLLVDDFVTFGDLKGVITVFVKKFFGPDTEVRFRPSYFPFTEPSAEVDIGCVLCGGKGCRVCSGSGWLEVMGAGMVDPEVFKIVGYDPEKVTGFAFGMGIERLAMLKYGIDDIRLFFENDLRFLEQF
jgi:phenylalanyl-tRNA synthetase alpha chain